MATGFNTQTGNGEYHLQFETDNRDYYLLMQETARRCVDWKPFTNADRIRAMNDKELAVFLCDGRPCDFCTCPGADLCTMEDGKANGILKWLQQPAEGE